MIFIYITTKNKQEAKKIARHLLQKKLIACANFFPMESMYRWNNKIQTEKEYILLLKTEDKNFSKIKQEVTKLHSYDIPCIAKIQVDATTAFGNWVRASLKNQDA